jgi:hypothetical protein
MRSDQRQKSIIVSPLQKIKERTAMPLRTEFCAIRKGQVETFEEVIIRSNNRDSANQSFRLYLSEENP